MTMSDICHQYLEALGKGNYEQVIQLFSANGVVLSPLYGQQSASKFYHQLAKDTQESKLRLIGIYEEPSGLEAILLFDYQWTLSNGQVVNFRVADHIKVNSAHEITWLEIIYDTVQSRPAQKSQAK